MDFIKKQTVGVWMYFASFVLTLITLIVYNVNINGAGYFNGANVPNATKLTVCALIFEILVIVCTQVKFEGVAETIINTLVDIVRIVIPSLLAAALITILSTRITGFAFIYFSNEEVLQEVQTQANLSSAHGTVANMVLLAVSAIFAIVSAAFSLKKRA